MAERHLLIELASCAHPDISEMAAQLLLDKSTTSRLVAKAVKKKLTCKFLSEVLVLGLPDSEGAVVLVEPAIEVPNGARLH